MIVTIMETVSILPAIVTQDGQELIVVQRGARAIVVITVSVKTASVNVNLDGLEQIVLKRFAPINVREEVNVKI